MSGVAGRSRPKTFAPTPEQRSQVKILVGLGIPQEKICLLVINPQTGKPLDPKSLRKHFKREIAISTTELHARVSNFIVSSIFGMTPPAGTVAIDNQHVRGALAIFFAKTRMGWKETVVNRHEEHVKAPVDGEAVRKRIMDKLDRLARANHQFVNEALQKGLSHGLDEGCGYPPSRRAGSPEDRDPSDP